MVIEGYTRKSRALGDPDDPALLATHVDLIRRMAAEDGVQLPEEAIYREIGSGETIEERPTFAARLAYWESLPHGAGGRIYTPEVSRLTRGEFLDAGRLMKVLQRAALLVRVKDRTYDLRIPADHLTFGLMCLVSHHENAQYRQRVNTTWEKMLREGKSRTGRKVFGYLWDYQNKVIQPDPENFERLCRLLGDAFTLSTRELAQRYSLPRWKVVTAITSPIVCGYPANTDAPHHGTKPWKKKRYVRLPLEEWRWPESPGDYPAAISREKFLALQHALNARKKGESRAHTDAGWCRDVVRFEGQPEGCRIRMGHGHATAIPTYETSVRVRPALYIHREVVHAAAVAALQEYWRDRRRIAQAVEQYTETATQAVGLPRAEQIAALEQRIKALRTEMKGYVEAEVNATGERLVLLGEIIDEKEGEVNRLVAQLNEVRSRPTLDPDLTGLLASMPALFSADFDAIWAEVTDVQRRQIIRGTLQEILVRVTSGATNRQYCREIVSITPKEWIAPWS